MGLVSHVIFEMNCPFCKNLINDFQTSYWSLDTQKIDLFDSVVPEDCVNMFGVCGKCKAQLEFSKNNEC